MLRTAIVLFGLLFFTAARAEGEAIELSAPGKPVIRLDAAGLAALPRSKARAGAHDAPPSDWEGVALAEVVRALDAPSGKALRGPALTMFVRVTASDGYQVVFSLAELDADLGHVAVLLADRQDGKPLAAGTGPFRLVVPGDPRPARWVRQVRRIELVSAGTSTKGAAAHDDGAKH